MGGVVTTGGGDDAEACTGDSFGCPEDTVWTSIVTDCMERGACKKVTPARRALLLRSLGIAALKAIHYKQLRNNSKKKKSIANTHGTSRPYSKDRLNMNNNKKACEKGQGFFTVDISQVDSQ